MVNHGSDGLLVAPNDPVSLAQAILTILEDEPLRMTMGQRGRAKVEAYYGWQHIGERLERIYQEVLEEVGSPKSSDVMKPLFGSDQNNAHPTDSQT